MNRPTRQRRGGYVLVLVALLLFGLFALAALVIDLGFARLSLRQLQTAADAAALEGLRGEGDASLTFADRQAAAELVIAQTFDDDLDATNGDDGIAGTGGAFGAGPLVEFSGGVGDPSLVAGQLLTVDPNNPVHVPAPVRGAETPGEFSVILQRGGVVLETPNLLSVGPAVPFLFGRASLVNRELVGNGLFLGGEAVATGSPALAVGLPVVDSTGAAIFPGAVAIGFRLSDWNGARTDPRQIDAVKTTVGQTVVEGDAATLADGYCCIYASIAGADRVVGFGQIAGGVALQESVAVANATGRLSDAWAAIDPTIREAVLAINRERLDDPSGLSAPEGLVGGLLVASTTQ